jgi:hypothetical protein
MENLSSKPPVSSSAFLVQQQLADTKLSFSRPAVLIS